MATYKTPGVYIEEISTFPPSVAEVSTAIPAFIGYTSRGPKIARISTLLEYEALFGTAEAKPFIVTTLDDDAGVPAISSIEREPIDIDGQANYLMYYHLSLYFKNGGGACYIISVGNHPVTIDISNFENGLNILEQEDEPTLIVFPDAVNLNSADYYSLCQSSLALCQKMGDRFAILDVQQDDSGVGGFRENIGTASLQYGAAYYPYLKTSLSFNYIDDNVTITPSESGADPYTLSSIKLTETALYNLIKTEMANQRVTLPPSAAIAGIYARVDRNRGVWKSPANESISSVIGPVTKVTLAEQENLNVDSTAGMSINVIREFTGKGTLVWGARTLAGNDNEWRYISVRRLFNLIEESTQKATAFAVFEPNDANTWLKIKAMIESYLYGLWEQGAMAGSTPESAYYVNVGLGKTMTAQDILEGRAIVEIGIAAVRPAEFIIIRFSHKLQEA